MSDTFSVEIKAWQEGQAIPSQFAFGRLDDNDEFALSDNHNPAIRWSGAPAGTKSFALLCYDPDVPSSGEDVNQKGKVVPADLPRVDFFH